MNATLVDKVAQAVLYEGYMLYPYRPSVKNRQRWTFGGICPQAYSLAQKGAEPWTMQTECLVVGDARTRLGVKVRFLHLIARTAGQLAQAIDQWPAGTEPVYAAVASLQVDDRRFDTWQEAAEREVVLGEYRLQDLIAQPQSTPFACAYQRSLEPVGDRTGKIAGLLVREQWPVEGTIEVSARQHGSGACIVRVVIANLTPLKDALRCSRDAAMMQSLISTHTILTLQSGEFVSLTDPPEQYRQAAAECQNVGAWPVLVGEAGARDTVLASPIILYDYPQIAPESPGDLFDGTEIDEILTLRIMTLTDQEQQAMAAVDERTRSLLQRTQALTAAQMQGLRGTLRNPHLGVGGQSHE